LDVRSPVSAGQTALYVKGDTNITGTLVAGSFSVSELSVTNVTASEGTSTQFLNVTGISTFVGFATFRQSVAIQTDLYVGGISTFAGFSNFNDYVDVQDGLRVGGISTFSGSISVGGTTGVDGQYLRSTGTGVTWGTFPVLRTSLTTTATTGQTGFTTTYNVGFIDVFVNGVRLSPSEFTATDGSNITLTTPCFGGESVDILAYSTISTGSGSGSVGGGSGTNYWTKTTSGIHTLGNVGIGTTNPRFALEVGAVGSSGTSLYVNGDARITGILTVGSSSVTIDGSSNKITVGSGVTIDGSAGTIQASTFIGDGSGLIGVVGSGSGVIVKDSDILVGTAGTINFGTGLSVSPISAGVVTVTSSGGGESYWVQNSTGIHTTSNIGIGTTTASSALTVSGNVSIGGTVSVDGGVKLATNNATIVGTSGTVGEIKRIGGAPFFYDGSAWREFVLSSGTPVSVPADTEWDNVVFRATFDTDFTDAKFSATPVYVSAGSSIVGAAVTIGTGAFRNNGAVGSGVSYAYRSDYDFTGSWTIEFWMYVDSSPVYSNPLSPLSLVSMNSTTGIGTSGNWTLAMWEDAIGNKYISWWNQGGIYSNGTTLYALANATWNSIIIDKWNHFALVREGDNGSLHFYVNGTEQYTTSGDTIIDNDILDITGNGLHFGGDTTFRVGVTTFNSNATADVIFDDVRISAGVGTAGQRYTSIGIHTYATFTPPTTALPTTGTLSSYVQPPGDKYGEITLGGSPTWRGTSGVTVSQQSSGNYRVSFASTYTNKNDYYVLSQGMDQGFASYVGIARSTTHVDLSVNRQSNDAAVDTGSLAVQIKNHI
jgi:hypothetical protein